MKISKINLNEINKEIAKTEVEINKIPKKERQLLTIQRKFNVSDASYSYLLQKKAEASIARASNIADNKIIDKAEIIEKTHPKKTIIYLIALIVGLFIPLLIIKIFDFVNYSIRDKSDIESNSSFPLLGAIAFSKYPSPLVVIDNPRSMVSETLRSVKANIDFIASNKKSKVIVFTSTISGEGKTFCSINLACAFALSDKKTILIGADLRKPKIFQDFNLTNDKGLTSYLIGKMQLHEVLNETTIKNLTVLTAGPIPPNPSELLASDKMTDLIEILKETYDYVIFDTAPIGIVTDALFIMRNADANIYVLRHNYTNKKVLNDLDDIAKTSGIKNLFLILNGVTYKKKKYGGYYNRYGYVYTYNEGYYEE
ncbi:MAG: polysaccharide biosynthesis tyrosine autokinase [Bacteroidetes bacterium]|nr:polysaccharide biosynthesis tyrosine autokinase [Bacteroidota bacterium]